MPPFTLASQVRRYGSLGSQAVEGPGVRECEAKEVASRSHTRHGSHEGGRQGKVLSPQAKREAVAAMIEKVKLSKRRACRLVGLSRSVLHYETTHNSDSEALSARLMALAHERRRFGYRRLHALVNREGVHANHKRVHRLYREAGLAVRRRGHPLGMDL
jgi:putative transposase